MTDLAPSTVRAIDQQPSRAEAYARASRSPATKRAYTHDWQHFQTWCSDNQYSSLPATPETVANYLATLADQGRAVATLTRRIAAISQAHQLAGHPSPTRDERVRTVMKGIKRTIGVAQTQKAPATIEVLRVLIEQVREGLLGTRDRALLLVGFAGAFRRSELVSLDVGDVVFMPAGMVITLRQSKTDQEKEGVKKAIPCGVFPATCPVRSLQAWIRTANITSGPIFRPLDRHGNIKQLRLTSQSVALVIKRYAALAKLDVTDFAGHSLRAGFATTAGAARVAERDIMRQTGHQSVQMVRRYIREGELFRDNAASQVGL